MRGASPDEAQLGKRNTMVMMFVGGVVLMLEGFLVIFLPVENLRGGSFSFPPEPL
jgi:hypothetical protein